MTLSHISRRFFLFVLLILTLAVFPSRAQDLQISDMTFVDESHGWVLATQPAPGIMRTADGGKSWARFSLPVGPSFRRIRFFNRNVGVAIAFESEQNTGIYITEDAGQNWQKTNEIDPPYGVRFFDVILTSPTEGFLVGEGGGGRGYVVQMLDAGRTIKVRTDLPVDFEQQSNTLGVFGDGTVHLWIVGKEIILHSADGGKNWEDQFSHSSPRIDLGIAGVALPGGHAWIAVANFEIYKTDDYGKHWVRALATQNQDMMSFESVSFANPSDGCAVGNSSFIYCTKDGGVTWSSARVFKTYPQGSLFFSKIQLFGSSRGWATVNGALYRTEDGGHSFAEVLTNSEPDSSDIPGESRALDTGINAPTELACDRHGLLYIMESKQKRVLRLDLDHSSIGVVLPEPENGFYRDFDFPNAITVDQGGNLFIADFNGRLRELVRESGEMKILLDASANHSNRPFEVPAQLALDAEGNVLVVDRQHKVFRWRQRSGKLETVAGTGRAGFSGDGGLATNAQLQFPSGVAVNTRGDIFVADLENCRVRRIDAKTQIITTIAGTGKCDSSGDGGPAISASLSYPGSMALDAAGNLFFVEGATGRVRRIDTHGIISTYAGTGQKGFSGDGGAATEATLDGPSGLTVDQDGALYISEFVNNRIRRVDPATHIITTVAGNGNPHRIDVVL